MTWVESVKERDEEGFHAWVDSVREDLKTYSRATWMETQDMVQPESPGMLVTMAYDRGDITREERAWAMERMSS